MIACYVLGCDYLAEGSIEDYRVCSFHDTLETRIILEDLKAPAVIGALFLKDEKVPKVFACGALTAQHFAPRECVSGVRAHEDPKLRAAVLGRLG